MEGVKNISARLRNASTYSTTGAAAAMLSIHCPRVN
jgi:hypothetical protein